ncbi:ABC transporter ATP-binding protein [Pelagicoccus sp. SDUM812005]|uniref:ABC transporter ATP-binding protein n=1 Tax=Pelagicoccus sp. SDUM812005 TaxID=3041257 RepID=UPI00280D0B91|nr:ABC transporter ATP-binding protein [Pelagicoccus sp. SDUM812005]MDQ8181323.1 ABC transporter ATP-binding protein [Pelagicoccus sp. SDUM812005]
MSESEYVVNCQNVSKDYKIWRDSSSRLKAPIWALFRRAFDNGKDDNPYYSTFSALKDVSFQLKRGESIGIIGRNGSGKSTLLQILAGTLQPTRGSASTQGRVAALLELGSGFNPEFSGRENIYLYASILGFSRKSINEKLQEIIDFSELETFIDQPLKTYSSGMTIRLAFSVRIHLDPEILIIDEALAVGDFYFVQKCTRFIREFIKDKTLVLVTHDLSSVQNLCERCIWLKDGEVMYDGPPKGAVEKYLAYYHAASNRHQVESESTGKSVKRVALESKDHDKQFHDQREEEALAQRANQWEVLLLDEPAESFGTGEGSIVECRLEDTQGRRLVGVVGGEIVRFVIIAQASTEIDQPILGFNLKDRHGQYIFGENTFLANRDQGLSLKPEQKISATFEFRMPILHPGEYAFTAALAKGTQETHAQIEWVHEALVIRSESPVTHQGLCGIPMHKIITETL